MKSHYIILENAAVAPKDINLVSEGFALKYGVKPKSARLVRTDSGVFTKSQFKLLAEG